MKTTVRKWGNSLALRIPNAFAVEMNLQPGTPVALSMEGNVLAIRRVALTYTLTGLMSEVTKTNVHGEGLTARPAGKEVW